MELRQLRCFLTVAEELNFRRAAERLNMTQPPVTVAIQQLETELGFPLFERTTRAVKLSPFGASFRQTAQEIMEKLDKGLHMARRIGRGEVAVFKIGFLVPMAWGILPKALRKFRLLYPDIEIQLVPQDFRGLMEALGKKSCDLYLGNYVKPDEVWASRRLQKGHIVTLIPPEHRLAGEGAISVKALKDEKLLLPLSHYSPTISADVRRFCTQRGGFVPNTLEELDPPSLAILALSGLGIGLFPETLKTGLFNQFCVRPFKEAGPTLQTGLMWGRDKENPALRALVGEIVASATPVT